MEVLLSRPVVAIERDRVTERGERIVGALRLEIGEPEMVVDLRRLRHEQGRLLEAAWPLLAPGGKLLYATCSVFDAENEARAADFAGRHPDALRESLRFPEGAVHRGGQLLPSPSGAGHNQDGFYYALLRKR